MRKGPAVLIAVVALLALAAHPDARAQNSWQYTALGDSLAYGMNDSQGGYAARYRAQLQSDTGATVSLVNRGVPGWTSADLLNALRTDESLRARIASSQVVTFNIGGNDLLGALQRYQTFTCGGANNQQCLGETVARFKSNWDAIVAQILSLRSPDNTIIRTMDIYNPVVNQLRFFGVLSTLKPYLDDINRHIFLTAVYNRIPCARVYAAFNGPTGEIDASALGYMSPDGIHPNDAGHRTIADQFRALAYAPLQPPQNTFAIELPVTLVPESEPRASVKVVRLGPNAASAATVEFATVDSPAPVPCAQPNTGVALARCDYATTIEELQFAPGETEKFVQIPVVDDGHQEGTEEFQIRIDVPAGGALLLRQTAAVRIIDNELLSVPPQPAPNPINTTSFFVRQHYLDFLSREPELEEPWTALLNNCPAGDIRCDRVQVSANFFGSPEFRLKGFFVFKFYKATLGRLPTYDEIISDMRRVTGATAEEVFAKRSAFANGWVGRAEFKALYPDSLTDAEFVAKLVQTSGVALSGAVTQQSLTSDLATHAKTRAEVVAALVESKAEDDKEFNSAFVAMQYYGYLRRTPEPQGYQDWLRTISANPADSRTMVNGFVNSVEYRLRFGQQ